MAALTGFRASPLNSVIDMTSAAPSRCNRTPTARGRSPDWMIWTALVIGLAFTTSPAMPQAGVQLVKVDLSVVAKGYRMSKLIGISVSNEKNEKIGTLDDVVADKKQLNFAVLQVGGFLGLGGRLVVVPYESLVIDDVGKTITLPGASKDALKNLSEYNYPS